MRGYGLCTARARLTDGGARSGRDGRPPRIKRAAGRRGVERVHGAGSPAGGFSEPTGATAPAALALLTSTFAEGPVRARVLGLNGALLSAGFTVGAMAGGTLVDLLSRRAACFVNIPVALSILLLTPSLIGESSVPGRGRWTCRGTVTVTVMIFQMTLYLQEILGFSPLATGVAFGVPWLAAVAVGVIAGRLIGRYGCRAVLAVGMIVQGVSTLPLLFLGAGRAGLVILIPALFTGFFGHVSSIVAYTVTGTSGLPDEEQGLATGLTVMTQNVAITVGIPLLSAIAATRASQLAGIHLAIGVDVAVTLAAVLLVWLGLRPRGEAAPSAAPTTDHALAASAE